MSQVLVLINALVIGAGLTIGCGEDISNLRGQSQEKANTDATEQSSDVEVDAEVMNGLELTASEKNSAIKELNRLNAKVKPLTNLESKFINECLEFKNDLTAVKNIIQPLIAEQVKLETAIKEQKGTVVKLKSDIRIANGKESKLAGELKEIVRSISSFGANFAKDLATRQSEIQTQIGQKQSAFDNAQIQYDKDIMAADSAEAGEDKYYEIKTFNQESTQALSDQIISLEGELAQLKDNKALNKATAKDVLIQKRDAKKTELAKQKRVNDPIVAALNKSLRATNRTISKSESELARYVKVAAIKVPGVSSACQKVLQ